MSNIINKQIMKKITKLTMVLFALILFMSCNKSTTPPANNSSSSSTYSFEFTLDGTPYSWSGGAPTSTTTAQCVAVITGGDCSLTGTRDAINGPNRNPQILANFPAKVGTYAMDMNSGNSFLTILFSQTRQAISLWQGEITFNVTACPTGLNSHITGNFSGKLGEIVGTNYVMHPISGKFDACNITP